MSAKSRIVRERISHIAPKKNSIDTLRSTAARRSACQASMRASRHSSTARKASPSLSRKAKAVREAGASNS
jgi:hypothetical protein